MISILFVSSCTSFQEKENSVQKSVVLVSNSLSHIPDSVLQDKTITSLTILPEGYTVYPEINSSTAIVPLMMIPKEIGNFQNLKTLRIRATNISSLPNELTQLKKLDTLDIALNPRISIKDEFEILDKLSNLKFLVVFGTHVELEDLEYLKQNLDPKVTIVPTGTEFYNLGL